MSPSDESFLSADTWNAHVPSIEVFRATLERAVKIAFSQCSIEWTDSGVGCDAYTEADCMGAKGRAEVTLIKSHLYDHGCPCCEDYLGDDGAPEPYASLGDLRQALAELKSKLPSMLLRAAKEARDSHFNVRSATKLVASCRASIQQIEMGAAVESARWLKVAKCTEQRIAMYNAGCVPWKGDVQTCMQWLGAEPTSRMRKLYPFRHIDGPGWEGLAAKSAEHMNAPRNDIDWEPENGH